MSDWFEKMFGFQEGGYEETRSHFRVEEDEGGSVTLVANPRRRSGGRGDGESSASSGRRFHVGKFETPSVSDLRNMLDEVPAAPECRGGSVGDGLTFRHIVADVTELHLNPDNEGALFQAASQFNCLEMPSPQVRPEDGITNYYRDHTQGPACAIACPAGTVYRNYFVGGNGQGDSKGGRQLNTLEDVEAVLGEKYWKMRNGYALPVGTKSMAALKEGFEMGMHDLEKARANLRVGVHWDTEAAAVPKPFNVAQVYCSALPIAYDYSTPRTDWEPLARLCLDGCYEATLAVAAILARKNGRRVRAFLTKVGGGAFGNSEIWISDAIKRSLRIFRKEQIDVCLVHYSRLERHFVEEIENIGEENTNVDRK